MTTTVHIAIGNSDNKLTQAEWANFYKDVDALVEEFTGLVSEGTDTQWRELYGRWMSAAVDSRQSACWAFVPPPQGTVDRKEFVTRLSRIAFLYRQDSIAWNESVSQMVWPNSKFIVDA